MKKFSLMISPQKKIKIKIKIKIIISDYMFLQSLVVFDW